MNPAIDRGCYEFERQRIGDSSNDCIINLLDFSILSANWQSDNPLTDIAPPYGDGFVGVAELTILAEHWLEQFN